VAVIDTAKREIVGRIGVGSGPIQMYATPDGARVYVANQGTTDEPADAVSVSEVSTQSIIDTIQTGAGAHSVVISDDGRFVVVTNIVDGTVSVIEVAAGDGDTSDCAKSASGKTRISRGWRDITRCCDEEGRIETSSAQDHPGNPEQRVAPHIRATRLCGAILSAACFWTGDPRDLPRSCASACGGRRLLAHAELTSRSPLVVLPPQEPTQGF
jgi:hypothetical protein